MHSMTDQARKFIEGAQAGAEVDAATDADAFAAVDEPIRSPRSAAERE